MTIDIEFMSADEATPPEEKLVDTTAPQDEAIFYQPLKSCAFDIQEAKSTLQERMARIVDLNDDRLLALVGALIIENAIGELLDAIMPGYKSLRDNRDFTFSLQISVAKALRLIPLKILAAADHIRKIRNEFAHNLSIDEFSKLDPRYLQAVQTDLRNFNIQPDEEVAKAYRTLVLWTALALRLYTEHASRFDTFIRHEGFLKIFREFLEQNAQEG